MDAHDRAELRKILFEFQRRVELLARDADVPKLLDHVTRQLERALEVQVRRIN